MKNEIQKREKYITRLLNDGEYTVEELVEKLISKGFTTSRRTTERDLHNIRNKYCNGKSNCGDDCRYEQSTDYGKLNLDFSDLIQILKYVANDNLRIKNVDNFTEDKTNKFGIEIFKDNRFGMIRVSKFFFLNFWNCKNLNIAPIDISFDVPSRVFKILAYSKRFESLPNKDIGTFDIPEYYAITKEMSNGHKYVIDWKLK